MRVCVLVRLEEVLALITPELLPRLPETSLLSAFCCVSVYSVARGPFREASKL